MTTRRTETDILTAKRTPQIGLMHSILKKVRGPVSLAITDIQMNRVRKEGTFEEAKEIDTKVTKVLLNELKYSSEDEEKNVPIAFNINEVPDEGECYVVNATGSVINLSMGKDISITLAYVKDAEVQSALIFFPLAEEIYIAEKGIGVDGPDFKLRVAGKENVSGLTVGLFSPVSNTADEEGFVETFAKLRQNGCHIRMSGNTISDVLDLASGKLDAYVGENLSEIDVMIAELIIREAGGFTCGTDGEKVEAGSTSLVAANHKLQGKVLKLLAS